MHPTISDKYIEQVRDALYAHNGSRIGAARALGVHSETVRRVIRAARKRHYIMPGPPNVDSCYCREYWEPTPEEIKAMCAEIQAGWTDGDRASRNEPRWIPWLKAVG